MLDDILKFEHRVDLRGNALAEEMAAVLEASRESVIGKLAKLQEKHLTGKAFDQESLARRKAFLEALRMEIEKILAGVSSEWADSLQTAGGDVIQAGMTSTVTTMNAAVGAAIMAPKLTPSVVSAWFETSTVDGLLVNEWLKKVETATVERIVAAGRQSMIEGLGVQATARLIRKNGVEGTVPGLEGLARTFTASASNYAREKIVTEKFSDTVKGWKRMAVLDGRTCIACGSMDGKTYGLKDPKPALPAHWRCRCVYLPLPVTFRDLGIDIDEFEGADRTTVKHTGKTVHHKDGSTSTKFKVAEVGKVAPDATYHAWMKQQLEKDPAFVRQVLGKTRFELFKSGKLSLEKMAVHGKIKKLSEL